METHAHRDLERLFDDLFDPIYRYLRVRIPSNEDAEDLAAETFAKAWKRAHAYDAAQGTLLMWLFGIARNEVADYWKRRAVRPVDLEAVEALLHDDGRHAARLADDVDLDRLLGALSEEQRALVCRHYLDGVPYAELARAANRSESAVRQLVSRALRSLRNTVTH